MSQDPQQAQQPQFQIEKIYVKDLSLEIPNAPQVFMEAIQPQLEVQVGTGASAIAESYYEVTVTATVTARGGDKTMFLAEAVQAGIFSVRNITAEDLQPLLGIGCPNILFPYLREAISDVVTRGGFPPVLLAPISFESIYLQRMQEQQNSGPRIELPQ